MAFVFVPQGQEADALLQANVAYPSTDHPGACYAMEIDYEEIVGLEAPSESHHDAIMWPSSQRYMGHPECELINDPAGLDAFGPDAYWVPVSIL